MPDNWTRIYGVVRRAGGGEVSIIVNVATERYPDDGQRVILIPEKGTLVGPAPERRWWWTSRHFARVDARRRADAERLAFENRWLRKTANGVVPVYEIKPGCACQQKGQPEPEWDWEREPTTAYRAEIRRLRVAVAEAVALLDAWCAAAEDGEALGPLREQTLGWLG